MKTKTDLNVDSIGEQNALTKDEEKAISEFFQLKRNTIQRRKTSKTLEKKDSK